MGIASVNVYAIQGTLYLIRELTKGIIVDWENKGVTSMTLTG
ncbi:hypothetical protein KsCSTR_36220 [Candidatus Kuenenia stuttgartiensis]|jgi:hypothetical protein|uniref:Uncharacterized protein n=1 Tax=Kuenenia stuttgartiensis TaxID=174633 RepID=A0A6G7GU66_KUEST|nr:hypothetical protein KsCSTR_36220 [Candidatus Kuenenia stuttgartiensis]